MAVANAVALGNPGLRGATLHDGILYFSSVRAQRIRNDWELVPFNELVASVRVARIRDSWILNPTFQQLEYSDVDIVVAGTADAILMVEGGARVVASFHAAGLVDRYVLYVAPSLFGGSDARPAIAGTTASSIDSIWRGRFEAVTPIGTDVRLDIVPLQEGT